MVRIFLMTTSAKAKRVTMLQYAVRQSAPRAEIQVQDLRSPARKLLDTAQVTE